MVLPDSRVGRWLNHRRPFLILLALNVLVSVVVFFAFHGKKSGDQDTYLGYAEGLAHGRYSYWYFLPDYLPDTFRNAGYPVFLFLVRSVTKSILVLALIQLALYFYAIWLALQTLSRLGGPANYQSRNLFLLLLLPNVQGPYFAAVVYPEILVMFLVMLYYHVVLTQSAGSWRRTVVLGLLAGVLVQVRPVFLFFPVLQIGFDWLYERRAFRAPLAAAFLLLFGGTLIPYGLWNYKHHGVFKVTSLEGGGGVMQIGFWALRMPSYREQHYWTNTMGDEIIQFVDPADVPGYIDAFNAEWAAINRECAPLQSHQDSVYGPMMRLRIPHLFPTYSSAYTRKREELLVKYTIDHIRDEPGYFLKTRLYTLVRLWVTGIQRRDWFAATSAVQRLKVVYPALVSGFTFLLALVCIPWALVRRRLWQVPAFMLALGLVGYFGVLHLPFAIQARYTIPVRLLFFLCIAQAVSSLISAARPLAAAAPRGSHDV